MIDIHTHLHPPKLFAAIRRWFAQRSSWDVAHQPTEPSDVAAALRAAGVERFVFCSYAHRPGMARDLNAWLARTSRALGGYGLPLATVHLDDATYLEDLHTALDDGCIGLKLHEDVQGLAADDARFGTVYAELAARGAFLLVHAGPFPWRREPGAGAARIARVLAEHPTLAVVVAHFGVPDSLAYFALMEREPLLYLDTTMILPHESPLAETVDPHLVAAHCERVLYGTDFPNVPYPYASELRGLEALRLPPEALRAVVHDNAARLLARAGIR